MRAITKSGGETMDKYEYVENIIAESSTTFHKAFSMIEDENKRKAVYTIYAFCRIADDAVDIDEDIKKIEELEEKIAKTFAGDVPKEPLFEALYETIMRYPSDKEPYLKLLEGLRDDYEKKPIETEKDLDEYAYKVAGTVGIMLIPVLASKSHKEKPKEMRKVGIELGKAMQLTNILRDVKDDLQKQRVYFPEEVLGQFKIRIKTLITGTVTPEYQSLVEHYIDKAKKKYKVFYENLELFDKDAVFATYAAAKFYEAILEEIRRGGYSNITRRHYVGKFRKWRLLKKIKKDLKKRGLLT